MITLKLKDLESAVLSINKLASLDMPIALSYQIAKISLELSKELEVFYSSRQSLYDKYCEQDKDGEFKVNENGGLVIKEELRDKFQEEYKEFLELPIDIDCNRLKLSSLDNANIFLTPIDTASLEQFIENDIC